ncbi:twin-arginine translocase TatA/TatE family subunit [Nesterenkonia muleiensis]|uniref:twin-arginine translocase TatA/TatE family subunit n=1 Tax=Nesterenkonia muleiensis TaxID=2282648 RepID=UPI000E758B86|nr:twin-arginine translocase TatA/TatE family subunit [Nesterenkonia muleiensis]
MLGLTFDKLLIIGVLAAVLVGPQRLPYYTKRLTETLRAFRSFMESARKRAETHTGVPLNEWESWDLRQYDPRRIVREALDSAPTAAADRDTAAEPESEDPAAEPLIPDLEAESSAGAACEHHPPVVAEKPRYIVTGSSGHPRRVLVNPQASPAAQTSAAQPAEEPMVPAEDSQALAAAAESQ